MEKTKIIYTLTSLLIHTINKNPNMLFKGKTGDWKNHISPELNKRVDNWIAKNLEGSDLQFVTELDKQD